jgi:hypothetical protein
VIPTTAVSSPLVVNDVDRLTANSITASWLGDQSLNMVSQH